MLELDVLMIDTHPGLNEEMLLSIAISDALAIILRPDQQDYQGTSVTVFDMADVKARVEQTYHCDVAAVLPHSDEMMALASAGIFALRYPDHPVTAALKQGAAMLVASE